MQKTAVLLSHVLILCLFCLSTYLDKDVNAVITNVTIHADDYHLFLTILSTFLKTNLPSSLLILIHFLIL